jgi:hypothetical protein
MNFLRSALYLCVMGGLGVAIAQEGDYDHESLTTTQGQVYREIYVMGADATGLTFRHREGIAKVGYDLLSPSYCSLYEPVEDLPGVETAVSADEPAPKPEPLAGIAGIDGPILITIRQQVRIPLATVPGWGGGACYGDAVFRTWPRGWVDHREVLRLADPCWRGRAVRDFLVLSGLQAPYRVW